MPPNDAPHANPFEVLGVPFDADDRAVRQAFALMLREARAAANADRERAVQEAFASIRDEVPRRQLAKYLQNEDRLAPLLSSAQAALERGDVESSQRFLCQCLQIAPDCIAAYWGLVNTSKAAGDLDGSIAYLESIESLQPKDPEAAREIAEVSMVKGCALSAQDTWASQQALSHALEAVRRARSLGAEEVGCVLLEGTILRELGHSEEERALLERLAAGMTQIGASELRVVNQLLYLDAAANEPERIQATLSRLRTLIPATPEKKLWLAGELGGTALRLLRWGLNSAQGCADLVAGCLPDTPEAGAAERNGDSPRQRFRAHFASEAEVMPHLIAFDAALKAGDVESAESLLQQILAVDPDRLGAIDAFANLALAGNDTVRAIRALDKLVQAVPQDPRGWHRLAWTLTRQVFELSDRQHPQREELLARAEEAIERMRELGVDEEDRIVLESRVRRARGLLVEDRQALRLFVEGREELGEQSLRVAFWSLQCLAQDGLTRELEQMLGLVGSRLPAEVSERSKLGEMLKQFAADLLPWAPGLGKECVRLALVCRPDDVEAPRLREELHQAWLNQRSASRPQPELPAQPARGGGIWSWVAVFVVISFMFRACVAGLDGGSKRRTPPNRPTTRDSSLPYGSERGARTNWPDSNPTFQPPRPGDVRSPSVGPSFPGSTPGASAGRGLPGPQVPFLNAQSPFPQSRAPDQSPTGRRQ